MSFSCKILLLAVILAILIESKPRNVFKKSLSRSKVYQGSRMRSYTRGTAISSGRMKYLFPTAAALGGIYIASRMRPQTYLRSYRDLDGYTVCQGRHTEVDSLSTGVRTYNYFLCPDDPDQPFERYCCVDELRGLGTCCSYDEKQKYYTYSKWGLLGGAVSVIVIGVAVGFCVYCLCCKRRRNPPPPVILSNSPATTPYTIQSPKPVFASDAAPPYPYPPGPREPPYPSTQPAPTTGPTAMPQPGSGWGAPVGSFPGAGWQDAPPPPYSAVQQAPNQATAPIPPQ